MKKLLLTLMLLTAYIYAKPICTSVDTEAIKKLHSKATKELKRFTLPREESSILCEAIVNSDKAVVVATYQGQDGNESLADGYLLSIVVAVVSGENGKILQSTFLKDIATSDAVEVKKLSIDTKTYSQLSKYQPFGISIEQGVYVTQGHAMSQEYLSIFESRKNSIDTLLYNYELDGDYMMCEDYHICSGNTVTYEIMAACKTHNHCPMAIKTLSMPYYILPITDDEEPIEKSFAESSSRTLTFKKGKYVQVKTNSSKGANKNLTFDEVEKGAKNAKHYSRYTLAELIYDPLYNEEKFKKVAQLNDIAYYLQKSGNNLEAVMLLEVLLKKFPNRTVAYYNLADAYWELGRKKEAKSMYETYVKQMRARRKGKRVPQIVLERVR